MLTLMFLLFLREKVGKTRERKRDHRRTRKYTFRQQNANENVLSENENVFGSIGVGCWWRKMLAAESNNSELVYSVFTMQ